MNLSKEKKMLNSLDLMLSGRNSTSSLSWEIGSVGMLLGMMMILTTELFTPLKVIHVLTAIAKENLGIPTEGAAEVISSLFSAIFFYVISVFLGKLIYFNRKIEKKNRQIQNFCRENQETLRILFNEGWLEQKEDERKEISARANVLLQKLEDEVDPDRVKEVRKNLKKLAKKVDIVEMLK